MLNRIFMLCRAGFEKECVAEIIDVAEQAGYAGFCQATPDSGYACFHLSDEGNSRELIEKLDFFHLIFPRQWFACGEAVALPTDDRVTPLMAAIAALPVCADLWWEQADTNDGKSLARLAKALDKPLRERIKKQNKQRANSPWRLHIVLISGTEAYVGISPIENSARWAMGIPRLRMPAAAPSRSTLKLEEAWHWFIPEDDWAVEIKAGDRAVDLGAAPGGWSWQLANRGLKVTAVDNGPMAKTLMTEGFVQHIKTDGFTYEPKVPVVWLVCDIADKPARVLDLMVRWFTKGWCRKAIFNLKLPMKQRYHEVDRLLERMSELCDKSGKPVEIAAKQLYHDREEVTVFARRVDGTGVSV